MMTNLLTIGLKKAGNGKTFRIMKIAILLMMTGVHICYANESYSQETLLSIRADNKTIKDVFEEIESKSEYIFFYYDGILDVNRNVNIHVNNQPLNKILDELFNNTDNTYHIKGRQVYISPKSYEEQPPFSVKGKITDARNGEILIGVSVVIKGTGTGTVSDINGDYTIPVSGKNTQLVFSYIGFTDIEETVGERTVIDVKMSAATSSLDEIVVVGYGKQKKLSVTGALSQIGTEEILRVSTPNMANAIAGRIPGIITRQSSGEPGYDAAQVYIRGLASFGNTNPLILIDGVERDMNQINSQEVESFTILKDASATAVYGARGANGVILINTKRGKTGKPSVILRSEAAVLTALRLPEYINGQEYALLMNEALAFNGQALRWSEDEIRKYGDGSDPYLYPNVNWTDAVLKNNTWQTINNLTVTGGTDIIRYYLNVGYTLQEGLYKQDSENKFNTNAKISRYNFRNNIDVNLARNFVLTLGLGAIIQNGNYPGFSSGDILHSLRIISPIAYPIRNPDGSLGGAQSYVGWNPYGRATQSGYSTQDRSTLQANFAANWELDFITRGLSARGLMAYDRIGNTNNVRYKNFGVKRYMGKDSVTGEDLYSPWFREEQPMGYYTQNESNRAMYLEAQINYDRTFAEKHNVTGMLLFNQREYVNLNAGNSEDNIPYRRRGYAGRLTYAFDGRYLAEMNFGYNGSENFPKGKRYGFFPSASLGWIVSNESFMQLEFLNRLKIRGSYGLVGNDQIGRRFLFLSTINTQGQYYYFGEQQRTWNGMEENKIGNPDVTWEESTKTDFGLDIGLFKDKLSLQIDIFNEYRKKILLQRETIPRLTGIYPWSIPYGNVGEVKNKGLDALLEIRDGTRAGFFYSFQGNFTFARNEVVENDEPYPAYPYLSGKGKRLYQYWGFIADGFFKNLEDIDASPYQSFGTVRPGDTKYRDINGDGVIDSYDQLPIGYARIPEISFGFGGTVGYKNFDISIFFTGAANTSMNIAGFGMWPFYDGLGSNNILKEYYDSRWTPDNPNAKYPAVDIGNNPNNAASAPAPTATTSAPASSLYMKNANYLRLRNAEMGYTLPKKAVSKCHLGNVRFFLNGMNLYTWDHLKFRDPESNDEIGGYPLQRSINLGLQIDFN